MPADDKQTMRIIVAHAVLDALEQMDMHYPSVSADRAADLARYRQALIDD